MSRDPESEVGVPATVDAVRLNLIRLGILRPLQVSDAERAVLAFLRPLELSDAERAVLGLPGFPDTERGRRDFAASYGALTGR
jgi:hypothetical protein